MKWVPFELHTHTPHSDGKHSLLEMCKEASKLGLGGIALTDHNTLSGMVEAKAAEEQTGVAVIPGMEWTTFYGHMLTLGAPYCDWRDLGPTDISRGIERVHRAGGIVGIAHPYSLGSPICTGCHWEYEVKEWKDIDYVEVWHGMMPSYSNHNVPAYKLWTSLLNEGYHITATAGRDWHHSDETEGWSAYTFLGLKQESDRFSAEAVVQAIKNGRCLISMGPLLHIEASIGMEEYGVGDTIKVDNSREMTLRIQVEASAMPVKKDAEVVLTRIVVESNLGELANVPWSGQVVEERMPLNGLRWLRVKAMGMLNGGFAAIAFTNPIYVMRENEVSLEGGLVK